MKKTQIGAAIDEMLANTGKNTVNSPIATNQPITISMDLLPDVKIGDTITLKVTDVIADKNEVVLSRVEEQENKPITLEG
mgnify:CR=1 FL=1